jgi:hypothetical protein
VAIIEEGKEDAIQTQASVLKTTKKDEATFTEVVQLIFASRDKAVQAVSTALVSIRSLSGRTHWHTNGVLPRAIPS